jgi:hypothetical protein
MQIILTAYICYKAKHCLFTLDQGMKPTYCQHMLQKFCQNMGKVALFHAIFGSSLSLQVLLAILNLQISGECGQQNEDQCVVALEHNLFI